MKTTGRPLGSKNSYTYTHKNGRAPQAPDFIGAYVKRARVRKMNPEAIPWIYDCGICVPTSTAHYKIFGDTFICAKHLDELLKRSEK